MLRWVGVGVMALGVAAVMGVFGTADDKSSEAPSAIAAAPNPLDEQKCNDAAAQFDENIEKTLTDPNLAETWGQGGRDDFADRMKDDGEDFQRLGCAPGNP